MYIFQKFTPNTGLFVLNLMSGMLCSHTGKPLQATVEKYRNMLSVEKLKVKTKCIIMLGKINVTHNSILHKHMVQFEGQHRALSLGWP